MERERAAAPIVGLADLVTKTIWMRAMRARSAAVVSVVSSTVGVAAVAAVVDVAAVPGAYAK